MAIAEYLDPVGWYLQHELAAGLILYNVRHANYRLANDVRIAGIWVGSHDPADPARPRDAVLVPIKLNSAAMPLVRSTAPPGPGFVAPPWPFSLYRPVFNLGATYKSKDPVFGPASMSEFIEIEQDFQFARYGINPPHEPGAVLPAARLFPLLKFRLSGNAEKKARYLRVDLRMHVNLDDLASGPTEQHLLGETVRGPNQAGLFRDNEDVPFPINLRHPLTLPAGTPKLEDIFAAAEKPLQFEVIARALTRGSGTFSGQPSTWDNLHQWPYPYPGDLPSTPGAFHCMHMHWRWGAVAGDPDESFIAIRGRGTLLPVLPSGEVRQFQGLGWTPRCGGPLLDARVPDQTLRIAVTKNFNTDVNKDVLSTPSFTDLFTGRRAVPDAVDSGADLVVWICAEAFRAEDELTAPWEGTLFIHGLYFAHDPEPSFSQLNPSPPSPLEPPPPIVTSTLGQLRLPLLKPRPARKWERLAK